LSMPSAPFGKVTTNQSTANEPLTALVDGRLDKNYGSVFRNGVRNGVYKMDLGETKRVTAVSSWSFNQNGKTRCTEADDLRKQFRHGSRMEPDRPRSLRSGW
jgi:hypothetical protein